MQVFFLRKTQKTNDNLKKKGNFADPFGEVGEWLKPVVC